MILRSFLIFLLLLTFIILYTPAIAEESENVEVLYIEGDVYFAEQRDNVVLILEQGTKLSYSDKLIILDNSSVRLRDKEGVEVEVSENTQAEVGELFGAISQDSAENIYVSIAIISVLMLLLLYFLFFRRRGNKVQPPEKVTNNTHDYTFDNLDPNVDNVYEDDIELRFDQSDREVVFEVIKGGVVPSYSTLRLDEKRVKCLLQKLNDMNEKWFEENDQS